MICYTDTNEIIVDVNLTLTYTVRLTIFWQLFLDMSIFIIIDSSLVAQTVKASVYNVRDLLKCFQLPIENSQLIFLLTVTSDFPSLQYWEIVKKNFIGVYLISGLPC